MNKSTFWVFAHGRAPGSARGSAVEIVEARRRVTVDHEEPGGRYFWTEFPLLPHGEYTVAVTFPSGYRDSRRVRHGPGHDQARFDEAEASAV